MGASGSLPDAPRYRDPGVCVTPGRVDVSLFAYIMVFWPPFYGPDALPAPNHDSHISATIIPENCKKFFICEPYEVHFALRIITQQLFCTNQSCQLVCFCMMLSWFLLQAL